ncbi:MAG: hypothetical protein MK160_06640 [Rhodobacteraceae bacterium]|nr:hypothetical protein [Paracoccaceae bacterium]
MTLAACGLVRCTPAPLDLAETEALYADPLQPPAGALPVYYLGHSLIGRDIPSMVAQLAGHDYAVQLGWGTALKAHWEPAEPINGFEQENAHPHFREAREALESGDYGAFVLTEMVEIEAAIDYFDAPFYLHQWARLARDNAPGMRIYLYETWHRLDDPQGWMARLKADTQRYWENALLRPAMNYRDGVKPIYVIPGGQVLARFIQEVEARGGIGTIQTREDLFSRTNDGSLDTIHLNDLGNYLIALTHYAVLYHRSPEGLAFDLKRSDGHSAVSPGAEAAQLMQRIVWEIVTSYPKTGVRQSLKSQS